MEPIEQFTYVYFQELAPIQSVAAQAIVKDKPQLYYRGGNPGYRILMRERYATLVNFLRYLHDDYRSSFLLKKVPSDASLDFDSSLDFENKLGFLIQNIAISQENAEKRFFVAFDFLLQTLVTSHSNEVEGDKLYTFQLRSEIESCLVPAIASMTVQDFMTVIEKISAPRLLVEVDHYFHWNNGELKVCCAYTDQEGNGNSYPPHLVYSAELDFRLRLDPVVPFCWRVGLDLLCKLQTFLKTKSTRGLVSEAR